LARKIISNILAGRLEVGKRGVGTTLIGKWGSFRLGVPPILSKSKEVCRIQLSADSSL